MTDRTQGPDIAIAMDVPSLDQALALARRIGPGPEMVKIGLELFTAAGPDAVKAFAGEGRRVFLDLKLHDIPNTVRGAARSAARLGAELLTVHASGGAEMIRAAVEGIAEEEGETGVVAVTVLTSLQASAMPPGFREPFVVADVAALLLDQATRAGARGIVCSAADLAGLRARHPEPFYAVTPGIRPAGEPAGDQRRIATIGEAVREGSNLIVLGRAVTAAPDPRAALERARRERNDAAQTVQG